MGVNVRFGSVADIAARQHHVRFTPQKRTFVGRLGKTDLRSETMV
jgi:hypothetical protein